MTEDSQWSFLPWREGDIHSNPFSDEFFSSDSIAASLVREPIQNSLDARAGSEPVLVRYTFSVANRLPSERSRQWFSGLWPHLRSKDAGLRSAPTEEEPVTYLLIEDFGTVGLGGDPLQLRNVASVNHRNDFFYFWRNLGRSGKSDMERGRWGLGKSVFSAASRIQTIFGLTVRASDQRTILYGQSVLGTHDTESGHFTSYGFFGQLRDAGTSNELALPVEASDLISEFVRDFSLSRSAEAGLSVIVPHPELDLIPSEIVRESIFHFYYPILSGDLVVEVVDERGVTRLARDTLRQVAQTLRFDGRSKVTPETLHELFDMAEVIQRSSEGELVKLSTDKNDKVGKWREEHFPQPASADARLRFNRGEIVGFRVPLTVRPVVGDARSTYFDAFFQRTPSLMRGDYQFIRQGIRISNVKTATHRGVRAMFVASDPVICGFLGDAEDPTHTKWEQRNRHFQNKYDDGVSLLKFVMQSLGSIAEYLLEAQAGMDADLLSSIFFVDLTDRAEPRQEVGTRDVRGRTPFNRFAVEVHSSHEAFTLSRTEGGFKIGPNPSSNTVPLGLDIQVAYEVRRGDPFRKYSLLDFDLKTKPIEVLTKGADVKTQESNRLFVSITNPEFAVLVEGFDRQRDIRVRVAEMKSADDSQV